MAKVCIIEDDYFDLVKRYDVLISTSHDIHIVLNECVLSSCRHDKDGGKARIGKRISNVGFNPENLVYGFKNTPTDADIYFCDGLRGECLILAERLGRERVYINTTNEDLRESAEKMGLKTLDKSIMDIVSGLK
jgi:hypothetical protein